MLDKAISKLSQKQLSTLAKIEKMLEDKDLPDRYPDFLEKSFDLYTFTLREKFIELMGFVLLSKEWIKDLSRWIGERRCLEVMAGLGALSYGLRAQGVNVIATDDYSWKKVYGVLWNSQRMWMHVEDLDAVEAVKKYGRNTDIIIMSWPPFHNDIAVKTLQKMREVNPNCIMIYIGEEKGGCTATDDFYSLYEEIDNKSFSTANRKFQSWPCIHDKPFLIR